ncbi:unnamed protein product [Heterobilharzia americana]|nr:unnamed protein product [Heterobilharzia americana]
MSFTHPGPQSEECALLGNVYVKHNYYGQSISSNIEDDDVTVNRNFRNEQRRQNNKGKYREINADCEPMASTSGDSVDITYPRNETTINCQEIEVPEIVNTGVLGRFFPFGFYYEFKKLVCLATPITITSVVAFLSGPVSLIFCGQLGKTALATVGLANSVFNVAGLAVVTGLLTAVDTLFSQVS